MSQWIRRGSNQEIQLDVLPQGERVFIQGSSGIVNIKGDVSGTIIVQGSNGMVKIGGIIRNTARVTVQGSNPILKHHGRDPGATVVLQGSNAEEIDKGGPKPPPDTSWLEFKRSWPGGLFPPKVTFADVPPEEPNGVFTIQKSARARGLWGT